MKRRTILLVVALCVLVWASLGTAAAAASPSSLPATAASSPTPSTPTRAAWTFAVYANEDNDLDYTWRQFTLRQLRALPANADVNVVAMVDWPAGKGVQLLRFSGRKVTVVASWPDKDFGSGETFEWFLKQVAGRYPSDHLAVDICDHGYGWRYVSYDATSNRDITMPELRSAIQRAAVPIDLLCFDACNMANIEAVHEIGRSGLIGYVVGSEETIDQDGIPYAGGLRPLLTDPSRTPRQVAGDMVSAWQMYYRPLRCFNWVSLTALDVDQVMQAQTDITAWVARLRLDLPQFRPRYVADLHHSIYAWDEWYVDLADVADRLAADPAITDPTLKELSTTVANDVSGAVVALWSGSYASRFKGLTIWWATGSDWTTDHRIYDQQISFATETGWYGFLKAFNAGHLPGPQTAPSPNLYRAAYGLTDVAFADADHGWATGYDNVTNEPLILRTTDGGGHWTTRSPTAWDTYMLSSLSFLDAQHAFAVGSEGDWESAIVKTVNGGGTWGWQDSNTVQYLEGVDFLNASHGWLVGSRGTLMHTTDGGRRWSGTSGISDSDLWSVDFADAADGWITGGYAPTSTGFIRHTSDGGTTWTTQKTVAGSIVYKVRALSGSQAWAVGGSPVAGAGVILHTTDGGLTWQTAYGGPTTPWLSGESFPDAASGWVVGEHGTVLRTTNGGLSWDTVAVPTSEDLTATWFTDAANGWIVGDGEAMLHTTDGGTTWTTTLADVTGPRTFAPSPSTVSRGARTDLAYSVTDTQSATATVTIRIRNAAGRVVKMYSLGPRATGVQLAARFVCHLPRGTYRFLVYARDQAGNPQTRLGWNTLTVK